MSEKIDQASCDSLSKKLSELDLSDGESAVLEAVLAAANEGPEVSGFSVEATTPVFQFKTFSFDINPRLITDRDTGRPRG